MSRVLVLLALCFAGVVNAQTCYEWKRANTGGSYHSSPQAACAETVAVCAADLATGDGSYDCPGLTALVSTDVVSLEVCAFGGTGYPNNYVSIRRFRPSTGATVIGNGAETPERVIAGGCPVCPAAGSRSGALADGAPTVGAAYCGNDGCAYNVKSPPTNVVGQGGMSQVVTVESRGHACSSRPETANNDPVDKGDCFDDGENIVCADPEAAGGQGCGYFNGDYICTGHVPDDSCVQFASGGVACVSGSSNAPTMPDGTTPAEPLGSVSNGSQTVNYYDGDTVGGSGSPVPTSPGQGGSASGAPGRDGSPGGVPGGSGDTIVNCVEGTPCVIQEDDGEEECPEGEDCSVSGPEFGEVCTFGECAQAFFNRVLEAPLVASVADVGDAFPTGSCPALTFELWGEEMSFTDSMCDLWESVGAVLSGVMLLVWGWVATRILLSA